MTIVWPVTIAPHGPGGKRVRPATSGTCSRTARSSVSHLSTPGPSCPPGGPTSPTRPPSRTSCVASGSAASRSSSHPPPRLPEPTDSQHLHRSDEAVCRDRGDPPLSCRVVLFASGALSRPVTSAGGRDPHDRLAVGAAHAQAICRTTARSSTAAATRRPSPRSTGARPTTRPKRGTTPTGGSRRSTRRQCRHDAADGCRPSNGSSARHAPFRVEAWDGSTGGSTDSIVLRLAIERTLNDLLTAPGTLGMARAHRHGDLTIAGVDEGDPYEVLRLLDGRFLPRRPAPRDVWDLAHSVGRAGLHVPLLPPQETPGRLRRLARGAQHAKARDAEAIHHHYDVSNAFYELVLEPSMTCTCACYPDDTASFEQAQTHTHDLVAQARSPAGDASARRRLRVGRHGPARRHALRRHGARRSALGLAGPGRLGAGRDRGGRHRGAAPRCAMWTTATSRSGLRRGELHRPHRAHRREELPRPLPLPARRLRDEGRLLNHCITLPDNQHPGLPPRGFINRYVFPDGELTRSGDIVRVMEDEGFRATEEYAGGSAQPEPPRSMSYASWTRSRPR